MKMKKVSLLILGLSLLISGLTFGSVKQLKGSGYQEFNILGQSVISNSSLVVYAENIGGYSKINGWVNSVSTGNITTASVSWLIDGGNVLTTNLLTFGTDLTGIWSGRAKITVYNQKSITADITANIIIR